MSLLSEYLRKAHPSPTKVYRVESLKGKMEHITIPVERVTVIKGFVLTGIVVSVFIPAEYAWMVVAFTNGYWMFKL